MKTPQDPRETIRFLVWAADRPGWSRSKIALRAGLSKNALNDLGRDTFNPGYLSLQRAFDAVPAFLKFDYSGLYPDDATIIRATRSTRAFGTEDGRLFERLFDMAAVDELEPRQLKVAFDYIRNARGRGDRPEEASIDLRTLRALVPDGAVHMVVAGEDDPVHWRVETWDRRTGWRGGLDFTDRRLADLPDQAYREAAAERLLAVSSGLMVGFSFIHRSGPDGTRAFYRLAVAIEDQGRIPKILVVTLPQETDLSRKMFPNFLGTRPD